MKNAFGSYGITFNDDSNGATGTVGALRREAVLEALSMHGPFRLASFACGIALVLSCSVSPGLAAAQTSAPPTHDNNAGAAMSATDATDDTSAEHDQSAADKTERVATDSWITTKVKSLLLADSVSKGIDVGVNTTHGVVKLSGKLPTRDAIKHVKRIAQGVQGVKRVDTSALTIGKP